MAALLSTASTDLATLGAGSVLGSALAVGLVLGVPRVLHVPRLPVPAEALAVDVAVIRRMLTHACWSDWLFPLLLGAVSAGLLAVATVVTGGFRPYWAVLALVSVLGPSSAETRRSAWQTVVASVAGVVLVAVLLAVDLPLGWLLSIIIALGLTGAVLVLHAGVLSKALLTPLPVVLAVLALDTDGALALGFRVGEYAAGAAVGVAVVVVAEWISRHQWEQRASQTRQLVG